MASGRAKWVEGRSAIVKPNTACRSPLHRMLVARRVNVSTHPSTLTSKITPIKNRISSKSLSQPFSSFQGWTIYDGSGHLIGQRHENPAWTGSWHWVRE
ncbi:hypothetical protein N7478_010030 [Penicillium angulare]|uniref:uncharacterized protein n=1 Tax=Penicillium angulare TaxID=116970 RepID=UPI002541012B|nr:uncharacterized protein N7478_010030 [Penicillium angulare]KAJ5267222.1 hypothetical protein N7478_010030 [Penicillium angulare]